jgi:hypothetical protein
LDEDREIQRKRVEEYSANQKIYQVMLNREKRRMEMLTADVEIVQEKLLASQANEAELKRNLEQQAKALADVKAAAATNIAAMAISNAPNRDAFMRVQQLEAGRDQLVEQVALNVKSMTELEAIVATQKKQLKQERTAKNIMQHLHRQEQRKTKNHLTQGKDLETFIQAKQETARVSTKAQRATWLAFEIRTAKEKELELNFLHGKYGAKAERERFSAAAKLKSKDEQIASMMTHQEREKKMLEEKLDAATKEAEANRIECIVCMDEFDKSDVDQWRMMIPCCHVFCTKCVEHHENASMPDCTLKTCPNCNGPCKKFLSAKIGGFVSDGAVTRIFDDN